MNKVLLSLGIFSACVVAITGFWVYQNVILIHPDKAYAETTTVTPTAVISNTCQKTVEDTVCKVGPKGEIGIAGAKGDTGAKGDPGEKGDTGISGFELVNGNVSVVEGNKNVSADVKCPVGKTMINLICNAVTGGGSSNDFVLKSENISYIYKDMGNGDIYDIGVCVFVHNSPKGFIQTQAKATCVKFI